MYLGRRCRQDSLAGAPHSGSGIPGICTRLGQLVKDFSLQRCTPSSLSAAALWYWSVSWFLLPSSPRISSHVSASHISSPPVLFSPSFVSPCALFPSLSSPFDDCRSVLEQSVGLFRLAGDGVDRAILRAALDDGSQVSQQLLAPCCSFRRWGMLSLQFNLPLNFDYA